MKYYRITAKLLSPLMVQQNRQSNTPQSLTYLPGSTLRGALAAKYFRMGGSPEDNDFRLLFLDNPLSFPNLFPASGQTIFSKILPMTSISCKRKPGFIMQEGHGVRDILAVAAASRLDKKSANEEFWKCPKCGEDMKPFSGFWNGKTTVPCKFETTMLFHRHTGIDRTTGTIAPTIFFTNQAMADFRKDSESGEYEQQYLSGSMFMSEEQLEILNPILEGSVFVGADRTRGMGELELSLEEVPLPEFDPEDWNKKFKEQLKPLIEKEDISSNFYFSITLESHAILTDKFLRPSSDIEAFASSGDFELILKIVKSQTIRGWQSAWGLAKPDDIGVTMGSLFLYQYKGNDAEQLKMLLNRLVMTGIGLRREEGFGRISVCDPLHNIEEVI